MMNLNSLGQSLGVPTITLTRHVAALSTAETRETHHILELLFCHYLKPGEPGVTVSDSQREIKPPP